MVTLAFEEHGNRAGRPFVLLHGFPLNRAMWAPTVAELGAARLILPDLRGHGESPVPDEPSTMERCAQDVEALLDRLGVERFVLGGFSLGGYVALELARRRPERLAGLLLVDTRAEADSEDARRKRHETIEAVRRDGVGVLEKSMMPKLLSERTQEARPETVAVVRRMIRETSAEGAIHALEGMASRPDQRPHLGGLRVPTLVVVGEKDELTPPAASRAMADALPDARLEMVAGTAHLVPMEEPERFGRLVKGWLDELDDAKTPSSGRGGTAATARTRSARLP